MNNQSQTLFHPESQRRALVSKARMHKICALRLMPCCEEARLFMQEYAHTQKYVSYTQTSKGNMRLHTCLHTSAGTNAQCKTCPEFVCGLVRFLIEKEDATAHATPHLHHLNMNAHEAAVPESLRARHCVFAVAEQYACIMMHGHGHGHTVTGYLFSDAS